MGLVTASSVNYDLSPQDRVIGYYVYDSMERDVAGVRDLLVDEDTHKPRYAIIEVGGFLSIRGKRVLLPWSALVKAGMSRLDINCSLEHIAAAPMVMDPYNPTVAEEESLSRHFNAEPYWEAGEETEIVTEAPEEDENENEGDDPPAPENNQRK
ncbi:MAG: PRC-barrel domain-containing protein [Candidatus Nitrospinota bacterium M3_3B_026]